MWSLGGCVQEFSSSPLFVEGGVGVKIPICYISRPLGRLLGIEGQYWGKVDLQGSEPSRPD